MPSKRCARATSNRTGVTSRSPSSSTLTEGIDGEDRAVAETGAAYRHHQAEADGGGHGDGGDRGIAGEGQQAFRAAHVERRAADPAGQEGAQEGLAHVHERVQPEQHADVAADDIAEQIDGETGGQHRHRGSAVQLQQGRGENAVREPDRDRVERRHAPVADQLRRSEQQHIDPGGRARDAACLMPEKTPMSPQPVSSGHNQCRDRYSEGVNKSDALRRAVSPQAFEV
jgi:hypothetical protein